MKFCRMIRALSCALFPDDRRSDRTKAVETVRAFSAVFVRIRVHISHKIDIISHLLRRMKQKKRGAVLTAPLCGLILYVLLFSVWISVQRLHRRDFEEHNFVMFHHASSSPRSPNNTGFYFPSCFILPRHRIGKWGKIRGNSRAVLNTHQMAVHYICIHALFPRVK